MNRVPHAARSFTPFSIVIAMLVVVLVAGFSGSALAAAEPAAHASGQKAIVAGGGTTTYVVQPGDTLSAIARRFNTTVQELVRLNHIPNPNLIHVGQKLTVPTIGPTPTPTPASPWTAPDQNIELFSPVEGAVYHSPIEVIGFSQTFEATVNIRLLDENDEVIAEQFAMGGFVDGFDFFHTYVRFSTNEQQNGTLEVYETVGINGEQSLASIPLVLLPGQRVVDLNSPTVGQAVCSPVSIGGYSNTFEANVVVALSERDGTGIASQPTQGGNLGIWRNFGAGLEHPVTEAQPILASAYEEDGIGLGQIDHTRVPVSLYPAGSGPCP